MADFLSGHIALVIPISIGLLIVLVLIAAGIWYIGRPFMGFMDGLNPPDGRTAGRISGMMRRKRKKPKSRQNDPF